MLNYNEWSPPVQKNLTIFPVKVDFHCHINFTCTHVKFTCTDKIEAMYARPFVNVKVEQDSTFTFTLTPILYYLYFIYVHKTYMIIAIHLHTNFLPWLIRQSSEAV